jgi:hypothetical protein
MGSGTLILATRMPPENMAASFEVRHPLVSNKFTGTILIPRKKGRPVMVCPLSFKLSESLLEQWPN